MQNVKYGDLVMHVVDAHSKGLFAGLSLEASVISSRPAANRAFYGEILKQSDILTGKVARPRAADCLYSALHEVMSGSGGNHSDSISVDEDGGGEADDEGEDCGDSDPPDRFLSNAVDGCGASTTPVSNASALADSSPPALAEGRCDIALMIPGTPVSKSIASVSPSPPHTSIAADPESARRRASKSFKERERRLEQQLDELEAVDFDRFAVQYPDEQDVKEDCSSASAGVETEISDANHASSVDCPPGSAQALEPVTFRSRVQHIFGFDAIAFIVQSLKSDDN